MKKESIKVYIQPAKFSPLGYVVETENQRELTKKIATGEVVSHDSPEEQWDLHMFLNLYLFVHATTVDTVNLPEHHHGTMVYEAKSGGIIQIDNSMGWSEISCDTRGAQYLQNLLRQKGYSIITTKEAVTG